jgi:hypothetical protein
MPIVAVSHRMSPMPGHRLMTWHFQVVKMKPQPSLHAVAQLD